jgi:GNAT superfamily N-acetyltransferase
VVGLHTPTDYGRQQQQELPQNEAMHFFDVRDRERLCRYYNAEAALHVYELGDLDPPHLEFTRWYGVGDETELAAVALVYAAGGDPIVLAVARERKVAALTELIALARLSLPDSFLLHASPGVEQVLPPEFDLLHLRDEFKMVLGPRLAETVRSNATRLHAGDADAIQDLLTDVYRDDEPDTHFFHGGLLSTEVYFGTRDGDLLTGVAGVHVVSEALSVAAVANVATRPSYRGRGIAADTTGACGCRELGRGLIMRQFGIR